MAYLEDKKSKPAKANGDLKKWLMEVRLAERDQKSYLDRADRVVERYRDEDRRGKDSNVDMPARFNSLWSNTETVAPLLFSRTPRVQVDRRFKDADPIGRVACQIWERCTQFAIDNYDFPAVMKAIRSDYQLAGRGTGWVKYDPGVMDDGFSYQEASCDHVSYKDFLHSPGKQWRYVRWVGRKIYLTKPQLKVRFPDKWRKIQLDYSPLAEEGNRRVANEQKEYQQACIYEIWDSDTQKVIWLSKNYSEGVLDEIEDPLGLHEFFPTPRPLFAVTTSDTLIPIPEYCEYQDQARELDQVTIKIALLEDSLRLVGFFDASYSKELGNLFHDTGQNTMIPIANWQKLQAAGGMQGIAEWMPIKDVIDALTALYGVRRELKQDMAELTGIADIIRGASSPVETATAQQIKNQRAGLRIEDKKREFERYCRDLIALQGEIIAEHFEPEIMAGMSGYDISNPDVQQLFMPAVELLKNDPMRSFRVTLETDSMIALDDGMEREQNNAFMESFTKFLQGAVQTMQVMPVLAPLLGETMMWIVRRHNAGRGMENAIEQGMQGLIQMAQQAMTQPKPPDPKLIEVQARSQLQQQESMQKIAIAQKEAEAKIQREIIEVQGRLKLQEQEQTAQLLLQRDKIAGEMELAVAKANQELIIKDKEVDKSVELETKKAILHSKVPDIHIKKNGDIVHRPPVIKRGRAWTDPETGERRYEAIEQPIELPEDEAA